MSARKRVRAFLNAPSKYETPPENELLSHRWENGGASAYDLRVQDLWELLNRADAAKHLRAKNATYVRRLKAWDALSPVTWSRWEDLQRHDDATVRENATLRETVAELNAAKVAAEKKNREYLRTLMLLPDREEWARVRTQVQNLKQELHAARMDAENQREEKISAQREVRDLHKQNQHALDASKVQIREYANQLLALPTPEQYAAMQAELADLRSAPFVSAPGGLSAEDLRKLAEDLLPQFLATLLSPGRKQ